MARERYESLQEVFDDAFRGLRAQGFARSVGSGIDGAGCAYRGDEGRRCAIGHCIPDEIYRNEMEGESVRHLLDSFPVIRELMPFASQTRDLTDLQQVHDSHRNGNKMEQRLRQYAQSRGLTVPED